jgi:hypothetical protein
MVDGFDHAVLGQAPPCRFMNKVILNSVMTAVVGRGAKSSSRIIVEESGTGRAMAWFGVGSGSRRAKLERAQQFEQADRVVVEAFADLHEARRLRSNPAISPGAVQRFERKAWDRLIDCLITLPPLTSDD